MSFVDDRMFNPPQPPMCSLCGHVVQRFFTTFNPGGSVVFTSCCHGKVETVEVRTGDFLGVRDPAALAPAVAFRDEGR